MGTTPASASAAPESPTPIAHAVQYVSPMSSAPSWRGGSAVSAVTRRRAMSSRNGTYVRSGEGIRNGASEVGSEVCGG